MAAAPSVVSARRWPARAPAGAPAAARPVVAGGGGTAADIFGRATGGGAGGLISAGFASVVLAIAGVAGCWFALSSAMLAFNCSICWPMAARSRGIDWIKSADSGGRRQPVCRLGRACGLRSWLIGRCSLVGGRGCSGGGGLLRCGGKRELRRPLGEQRRPLCDHLPCGGAIMVPEAGGKGADERKHEDHGDLRRPFALWRPGAAGLMSPTAAARKVVSTVGAGAASALDGVRGD